MTNEDMKQMGAIEVLDWACREMGAEDLPNCTRETRRVRDAIAELIAADEEYDRIRNRMYLLLLADPRRDALEEELKVCSARRAAALLACKGQDHER